MTLSKFLLAVSCRGFVAPFLHQRQAPQGVAVDLPTGAAYADTVVYQAPPEAVFVTGDSAPPSGSSGLPALVSVALGALAGAGATAFALRGRVAALAAAADVKIDAKVVKALRETTGAGMMDCKRALVDAGGDVAVATEALRKKGLASAEKKASRKASEGIVETYIHTGAKLGVMVEVNCETDFVAKRPEFKELARNVAMQVAACPTVECVSEADISPDFVENEKKIEAQAEDLKGKPDNIVEKIVSGRVAKLVKTKILLEQPYIRDPNQTVDEMVKSYVGKLGENIQVARFIRFNVGETQSAE